MGVEENIAGPKNSDPREPVGRGPLPHLARGIPWGSESQPRVAHDTTIPPPLLYTLQIIPHFRLLARRGLCTKGACISFLI